VHQAHHAVRGVPAELLQVHFGDLFILRVDSL